MCCRPTGARAPAAITGACAALAMALSELVAAGTLKASPLRQMVAATSVGIVEGHVLLDLAYEEDSRAEVDMNVVMIEDGGLVEIQATAERVSFPRARLLEMMDYAESGIRQLFAAQREAAVKSSCRLKCGGRQVFEYSSVRIKGAEWERGAAARAAHVATAFGCALPSNSTASGRIERNRLPIETHITRSFTLKDEERSYEHHP